MTTAVEGAKKSTVDIQIISPIVIIPFNQIHDRNSEIWVYSIGDLIFKTDQNDNFYRYRDP